MTAKSKTYILIALIIPVTGIAMSFFIKSLLIKRIFQVIFLGILTLVFVDVLREKYKRKGTTNYWGLAVVLIFSAALYLIIKKYS